MKFAAILGGDWRPVRRKADAKPRLLHVDHRKARIFEQDFRAPAAVRHRQDRPVGAGKEGRNRKAGRSAEMASQIGRPGEALVARRRVDVDDEPVGKRVAKRSKSSAAWPPQSSISESLCHSAPGGTPASCRRFRAMLPSFPARSAPPASGAITSGVAKNWYARRLMPHGPSERRRSSGSWRSKSAPACRCRAARHAATRPGR